MKNKKRLLLTCLSFALIWGCSVDLDHVETGPTETEPVSVDAGSATHANVELNMGMGQMTVSGGASKLVQGSLEYNSARMKPEVTSSVNGDHTTVTVRQPNGNGSFGKTRNVWDLQVSDKPLMDLSVNCGAGQAKLNLSDVALRNLEVHIGAGNLDVDLSGTPKQDYEVTINGGVGQAIVHLPQGVGISAVAHGGLGKITVTGLEKDGDHWRNDLYDKAKVNVKIDVEGGIGNINLIG